jgi:hypothetical protein
MEIKPDEALRLDTRGLPLGYDPHMFYEYRRETLIKDATGIESFVYKYIPWTISKSFVFAIDPASKFKVASHRITPYNRHRTRAVASVLQLRKMRVQNINYGGRQTPNFGNVAVCWDPRLTETRTVNSDQMLSLQTQQPLIDEFDDTTQRTRLFGSKQGTARFFKSFIKSSSRHGRQSDRINYIYHPAAGIPDATCVVRGGAGNTRAYSEDVKQYDVNAPAAFLLPNDLATLRAQEYAYLETLMSKEAVHLFKQWSPQKRSYTLFRNLVEVRDVQRSIVSLQKTLLDFGRLFRDLARQEKLRTLIFDVKANVSNIPSEYLSYHFGWKQLYKDVTELLELPEKLSKKYSFLIKRAGKPTTFRYKKKYLSARTDSLPSFLYDSIPIEYGVSSTTRLERVTELRLVVNAVFDFPPVNNVSLRSGSRFDRVGLVPRPTDIYNLIPWTWLVDWFTGLGTYVELIDDMWRDDSLVNWAMVTGHTTGRLITNRVSKVDNRLTTVEDFVGSSTVISTTALAHESVLEYECHIRKDAATVMSVNTISEPSLSVYQKSILGALLAQRKGGFTPRS